MTKSEIKAELRRAAMDEPYPYWGLSGGDDWLDLTGAWWFVEQHMVGPDEGWSLMPAEDCATFLLLIAEAL